MLVNSLDLWSLSFWMDSNFWTCLGSSNARSFFPFVYAAWLSSPANFTAWARMAATMALPDGLEFSFLLLVYQFGKDRLIQWLFFLNVYFIRAFLLIGGNEVGSQFWKTLLMTPIVLLFILIAETVTVIVVPAMMSVMEELFLFLRMCLCAHFYEISLSKFITSSHSQC